MSGQVNIGCK